MGLCHRVHMSRDNLRADAGTPTSNSRLSISIPLLHQKGRWAVEPGKVRPDSPAEHTESSDIQPSVDLSIFLLTPRGYVP
jgi:hypothetical protein